MLLSAMIAVLVVRCVKLFFPLIMPDSPNTVRTHSTCSDWLLSTHHQRKHLCRLSPFLGLNLTENYRLTFLNVSQQCVHNCNWVMKDVLAIVNTWLCILPVCLKTIGLKISLKAWFPLLRKRRTQTHARSCVLKVRKQYARRKKITQAKK